MIVCPNCSHQNPDSAVQCEACYTPLPVMAACPSCGAAVQTDASFCGQCGFDLRSAAPIGTTTVPSRAAVGFGAASSDPMAFPELTPLDPLVQPEALPLTGPALNETPLPDPFPPLTPSSEAAAPDPVPEPGLPLGPTPAPDLAPDLAPPPVPDLAPPPAPDLVPTPAPVPAAIPVTVPAASSPNPPSYSATQLQVIKAQLLHVQTNALIELPPELTVVRLGKPNDRIPPDVDVSGFPDSEIVSRVHANIRIEGDTYYLEDVGSSNGTYVNNMPLPVGNRHRLRPGDRISLGKGDKVSFLFQVG